MKKLPYKNKTAFLDVMGEEYLLIPEKGTLIKWNPELIGAAFKQDAFFSGGWEKLSGVKIRTPKNKSPSAQDLAEVLLKIPTDVKDFRTLTMLSFAPILANWTPPKIKIYGELGSEMRVAFQDALNGKTADASRINTKDESQIAVSAMREIYLQIANEFKNLSYTLDPDPENPVTFSQPTSGLH